MKKGLIGLFLGIALFAIAAQYGNIDCLGLLKVNTIQKLDTGVGVYVEGVYHASGVIGAPDDKPDIHVNNITVYGTATGISASAIIQTCNGRLTLESGVPVSTTDQTAKTVLYFTPYNGNQVALYDGTNWAIHTLAEKSLDISGYTANKPYDIFIFDNSGTLTLDSAVWTDDTTRATALATQDGIYVKSGDATRRYLGTIRITATAGQCETSSVKKFIWNYYNQVESYVDTFNSNAGWSYTTSAYREYNNGTGQTRGETVFGFPVFCKAMSNASATTTSATAWVFVTYDSTTTNVMITKAFTPSAMVVYFDKGSKVSLAAGYHYFTQMELGGTGVAVSGSGYDGRVWFYY